MASFELETIKTLSQFSNLKAYYRFESGALTTDSSGEGHTLTAISDPAEDASGKFGGAVALDGNDAYSAVDDTDFKPTGNFTIGAWVKTTASGGYQCIFASKSQNTAVAGIQMTVIDIGKARFASGKNTGTTWHTDYDEVTGGTTVNDGNWHFVVGTWDGDYLRIYVDGSSDATAVSWSNAPAYAATNYVRVGCINETGTNAQFFTGSLDDVFLLNGTALTATQISDIYTGACNALEINSVTDVINSANLKAYYRFSDDALTTDSSGEGHTLTAISDPAEDASGKFGGAVALDSNDAYSATDHADFKPTGNFTIGFWIKVNATTGVPFQSYNHTNRSGILILQNATTGTITFRSGRATGGVEGTDLNTLTGSINAGDNNWHFVVCVWDGAKMYIYVDGTEDINEAWTYAPGYQATNYVRVGCRCDAGTNGTFITGSLDDVFLLNGTALTDAEIKAIFRGHLIDVSVGSFSLTGISNILNSNRNLIASVASFTLTGIATILTRALNVSASVASFTLTGISNILTKALNISASVASFTLTGIASALTTAHILVADVASFTLSGIDTAFKKTLNIAATVAEFTLTGIDNILYVSHIIVAEVADFIITGADTILTRAINFITSVGEFTLTGFKTFFSLNYETKIIGKISRGIDLYGKIKTINISGKIKQQEITGKIQHL